MTLQTPLLAVLLCASLPGVAQDGDPFAVRSERIRERVDTVSGPLLVVRVDFESGRHVNRLALAGTVAFEDAESESVAVAARHPVNEPARVVLLRLNTGGSGCPALYMVVEALDDGSLAHSERFGNCSPRARTRYTAGVLRVDLPRIGGAPAEGWRYRDGKLERSTKPHTQ